MSLWMRRRRRPGAPVVEGRPFSDSVDGREGGSPDGRASVVGANRGALPRRELADLFDLAGYGAASPMRATVLRGRVIGRASSSKANPPPPASAFPLFLRDRRARSLPVRSPAAVRFCVQRRVRKEVLFAKQIAGHHKRSPGRGGAYFRRQSSQWSC